MSKPLGLFDSGFGGLTICKAISNRKPQLDTIYLGDNARAPYGSRSFESIYEYTVEGVDWLFKKGCPLVILACNTASARALRTLQQNWLPKHYPNRRVLGVIRPMTEYLRDLPEEEFGLLATQGTVRSNSYGIELEHMAPSKVLHQVPCPIWVPLIEHGEGDSNGAHFFYEKKIKELLKKQTTLKKVVLGCTHYPLIEDKLKSIAPELEFLSQGPIVANALEDYLTRHPEFQDVLTQTGRREFFSTEEPELVREIFLSFGLNQQVLQRASLDHSSN